MKITGLSLTPVAVPFARDEVWAFGRRRGLLNVILELQTDEGLVGIAEAPGYPSPEIVCAVFESLKDLVVGEDPFRIERIVKKIDVVGTWHHVNSTSPAIAAIETACWDIVGKSCGQPLVNLFGGRVVDYVPVFYYVGLGTPEEITRVAAEGAEQGFQTFYIKVGADELETDVANVAALRKGIGDGARIRIDANEAWSAGAAVQAIRALEPYGLEFVEQPVTARNLSEMAYVRGRIDTPILANEASWTRSQQIAVIQAGAADAISVDHQMDGGLLNMRLSAGLCEAAGIPVLKHSLGELGIATAAALHVIASSSNFPFANQSYAAFLRDDVLTEETQLVCTNGTVKVPDGPGLGVQIDRDKLQHYAELYEKEKESFHFHDPSSTEQTLRIPKR